MNLSIKTGLLVVLYSLPLTLNSTDIYHSSNGTVQIRANLNPTIIPGDSKLGSTLLLVSAPKAAQDIHIVSECQHSDSVLYTTGGTSNLMISVIELDFQSPCESPTIAIADSEHTFTDTVFRLPLTTTSAITDSFINTNSEDLLSIMRASAPLHENGTGSTMVQKIEHIGALYQNLSTTLKSELASSILHDRDDVKYISPVQGHVLPTQNNKIPGSGRPYRKDTTDGIHHGWDIMAPYGTPVRALSKGKIVRIIDNWTWDEFASMGKGPFSDDDKLRNLDIFRGNQIWLQSMDGNVIFYSHLSKISPTIQVGTYVEKGEYMGNIGTSGVPEKNYRDVHLHFEIQENPFREDMKNPNFLDMMRWDYAGEHMKSDQVSKKARELFE